MKFLILKTIIFGLCFSAPIYARSNDLLNRLDAEVGIEFPVYLGGHGKFSLNRNFYTRLGIGFVSDILLEGLHWYNSKTNFITEKESDLIMDSISNSLYTEIRLGYRFKRHKGFYAELGWSFMSLGKGETSSETLQEVLGHSDLTPEQNPVYTVKSNVHNITGHLGYMFPLMERFGLGTELGLIKPVYSDVKINYNDQLENAVKEEDAKKVSKILSKIWIFTGSLWVYYIF